MCFNKKFYIVKNDAIMNIPCHVTNYSPLMLGRPIIKLNPIHNPTTIVPIKITTPYLTFTLNTPFQYIRPLFDDIYKFRVQHSDPKSNEVIYDVQSPVVNTSVTTSYPALLKILENVGTLYYPGSYIETNDGARLQGLKLIDGLLQKLIDSRNR